MNPLAPAPLNRRQNWALNKVDNNGQCPGSSFLMGRIRAYATQISGGTGWLRKCVMPSLKP